MDNYNSKALKSGFWYIFSNLLVRAVTLIITPIFSRLLTKEQVGEYSNFQSWMTIAFIVVSLRAEASFISAKFDFKDRSGLYNRSVIALTALVTCCWALVVNIFSPFFTNLLGFSRFYMNLLLVYCFFNAVISIFQIYERFQYRYKKSVLVSLVTTISTAVVSILLVLLMEDRLAGRILGGILPIVAIGLVLVFWFFKRERSVDTSIWPYALKICIPYVPHLLSLQVLNSIDKIMIKKICGAADNALYTIAYTCGHVVTLLMTAMNMAFSPWLGDKLHEGKNEEIRKVVRYYITAFAFLAFGIMLLTPELLLIMGGRSYLEARYVMPPVAMGCVCQFLYTLYVNVEQYKKKTTGMAIVSVLAAGMNYGLNAIFIPMYGYNAAAYTTLAGYLFLLIAHMLLVRKLKLGDVYDNKFVLLIVGVMMVLTLGVNFIYDYALIRYIIIGIYVIVFCLVMWIKRDLVKRLFRMVVKRSEAKA